MASQSKPYPKLTPFAAALAGALGGCFSTAIVYPLDVAKTRIQVSDSHRGKTKNDRSMHSVILRVYKKEGISGLYRGFGATMVNTFSQQYAYFFFYSFVRNSYIRRLAQKSSPGSRSPILSTVAELTLGALAGALAQIFTIPVSVIATRQQVGRPDSGDFPEGNDDSFFAVAREIIEEDGISGLWSGLKPGLVLTVNPAITYGVFERMKSLIQAARARVSSNTSLKLSPWHSFLLGAFSKTLATVVTYPYIMAKVRIQARSSDGEEDLFRTKRHRQHASALQILARALKREGFRGWYQGMQAQITKAVLSQALLFVSKEQFEHWAILILLMSGRLSRS